MSKSKLPSSPLAISSRPPHSWIILSLSACHLFVSFLTLSEELKRVSFSF
nr:MAG TPA: hypothetical protein [Caudoviricetes sp.]